MSERRQIHGAQVFLALAVACLGARGGASAAPPAGATGPDNARPEPGDSDLRAFTDALALAVRTGDLAKFGDLIDWDAILHETTDKVEASPLTRKNFLAGAKSGIEQSFSGDLIRSAAGEPHRFRFLSMHEGAMGGEAALFRMLPATGGVNYLEFSPERLPDGKVRARRIYVYLSGESIAQTLRRSYLAVVAGERRSVLARALRPENEYGANLDKIGDLARAVGEKRFPAAMAIYKTLPVGVREDKSVLTLHLQAAQGVGEKEYADAIQEFRDRFPNDACIDLISLDAYLLKKQYPEALAAIDRIDGKVGGDPYLEVMRANVLSQAGDVEAAERAARRAVGREPGMPGGYGSLIDLALKRQNYDEVVKNLEVLRGRFHLQLRGIGREPRYAGFAKSPQYKAWLAAHPEQAPEKEKPATPAAPKADKPGP